MVLNSIPKLCFQSYLQFLYSDAQAKSSTKCEIIDNIMSDEEYKHHIRSLNKNQYEFFSHIMNVATKKDKQELCWLNGGAGTGKSHLLKALYQGLYHICYTEPGHNRETNKLLVMALTGKAACYVRGTTIHAAFHIPANQKIQDYKPLSYDTLNAYRIKYREFEWILVDEISMVSNDLWKYVHLRLQETMQRTIWRFEYHSHW